MFFLSEIKHEGEPPKVLLPDGSYCLTTVAHDVPVTYLIVAMILGKFRMTIGENHFLRNSLQMEFKANGFNEARFIGEEIIFFTVLGEMFGNSTDAGSSVFQIEVTETENKVIFTISDDGDGVPESIKEGFLFDVFTSKSNGLGCGLFLARNMMQKIGGDLSYKGKGIDGKGACFEMSFLKEMPY